MSLSVRLSQCHAQTHLAAAVYVFRALHVQFLLEVSFLRNPTSKPDAYVFPGGAIDAADANGAWMEHFTKKEIKQLTPTSPKLERPPLYVTPDNEEVPRDLSLRIGAIRETFEESGILILDKNGVQDIMDCE